MRRTHLRGHKKILKRLLIHIAGFNLGILMRSIIGFGTPKEFAAFARDTMDALLGSWNAIWTTKLAVREFVCMPIKNGVNLKRRRLIRGVAICGAA